MLMRTLVFVGILAVFARGEEKLTHPRVILEKTYPRDSKDLDAIQQHVGKLVRTALPATVCVSMGESGQRRGFGSGVLVSKDGLIMTAGHVSGHKGSAHEIILHDGTTLPAVSLGQDMSVDVGFIKIKSDRKDYPFLKVGESGKLHAGSWVITLGHPAGLKPGRTPPVRFAKVLDSNDTVLQTDGTIQGGDSGGPVLNVFGEVVGINSRVSRDTKDNFHVPSDLYKLYLELK